ncbi:MAG: dihydropteroate synthase [Dethiobacteria bacterium]
MNFTMVKPIMLNNITAIRREMEKMGVDPTGIKIMEPKNIFFTIKVADLSLKAALLLKQEMLSKGGEAALPKKASMLAADKVDALLSGTKRQFQEVIKKLKTQPFGLNYLATELERVLKNRDKNHYKLQLGEHTIYTGQRTIIMGILNVTPDSFSDGGRFTELDASIKHALQMVEDGVDIIDVGGESTRPGYLPVSLEEELARVIPVIKQLKKETDVPISIDSYKAEVAKQALEAGAVMVNDVWGLKADPEMAAVVSSYNVPVCIMHNRKNAEYNDLLTDIMIDLQASISLAYEAGVSPDQIIIDPGIGFAKNWEENLEVMNRQEEFKSMGFPLLLGVSRKSTIGRILNLPADERLEGTAAAVAVAIAKGADIIRVHDVKEMKRVADMTDAIVRR